jgi:hypothetical protein
MEIKGTLSFIAVLLATSAFAAGAEETTGTATPRPDATAAMRALLADPAFAAAPAPAENGYDFATADDIPGFGPLDPAEHERRVVRLVREY